MTIINSPYPFIFVNGTVADATQVDADFDYVQSQVNANAAHNGANTDITSLNNLTNFVSTNGTVTGTLGIGVLNVSGIATFAQDIIMTGTGGIKVAAGTTGQRPGTPQVGDLRYNTTLNTFEGYLGASPTWSALSASGVGSFPMSLGLQVNNNPGVPNTKVDIACTMAQIVNPIGTGVIRTSVTTTIDATIVGANGLDVGTLTASTWYYVWLIDNGLVTSGLLSLSSTAPSLPSGYIFKSRVGAVRTDGSSHFFRTLQVGARTGFVITPATTTSSHPVLTTVTVTGTATSFSVAPGAPPTAPQIIAILGSSFTTIQTNVNTSSGVSQGNGILCTDILLESGNLYYFNTTSPSGDIRSAGWVDSVIAF